MGNMAYVQEGHSSKRTHTQAVRRYALLLRNHLVG